MNKIDRFISFTKKTIKCLLDLTKKLIRNALLVIIILGPALYFGVIGKPAEMGISIIASSLVLVFMNIDKFEFFKGGGFEAKLRDIEKAKEDAYATIEALKTVAGPIIAEALHTINWSGRLHSDDAQRKLDAKADIDRVIEFLKLDYAPLKKEQEDFYILLTWDIFRSLRDDLFRINIDRDILKKVDSSLEKRWMTNKFMKEEEFKGILGDEYKKLSEENFEKFKDYVYFGENKKLRRTE